MPEEESELTIVCCDRQITVKAIKEQAKARFPKAKKISYNICEDDYYEAII